MGKELTTAGSFVMATAAGFPLKQNGNASAGQGQTTAYWRGDTFGGGREWTAANSTMTMPVGKKSSDG